MPLEDCDVVSFRIVGPYALEITFADGSQQVVNLYRVVSKGVLCSLRDLSLFNQVRLDLEIRNLVWPGDIGFDFGNAAQLGAGGGEAAGCRVERSACALQQCGLVLVATSAPGVPCD